MTQTLQLASGRSAHDRLLGEYVLESVRLPSLSGEQALLILAFMGMGIIYAAWFKRRRATLGFIGLAWLSLALGAKPLAQFLGMSLARDLSELAYQWLPWNLLILSVLPTMRSTGWLPWAYATLLLLELALPFSMSDARWAELYSMSAWIETNIPSSLARWVTPFEAVIVLVAALAMFVRWQLRERHSDLALCIVASILLLGVLHPQYIYWCAFSAGIVLMLSVLYSSHRMAFVDPLTGLSNRRALDAAMTSLNRNFAVAMLDVDHFKRVNDRFGHDFGDQVLRMVATRLKRIRRFRIYRYGGEEFCMLFKGAKTVAAREICEVARQIVADQPIAVRGLGRPAHRPIRKNRYRDKVTSIKVTVSIGLARANQHRTDAQAVIEAADKALYRAKRSGRNKVMVAR